MCTGVSYLKWQQRSIPPINMASAIKTVNGTPLVSNLLKKEFLRGFDPNPDSLMLTPRLVVKLSWNTLVKTGVKIDQYHKVLVSA